MSLTAGLLREKAKVRARERARQRKAWEGKGLVAKEAAELRVVAKEMLEMLKARGGVHLKVLGRWGRLIEREEEE